MAILLGAILSVILVTAFQFASTNHRAADAVDRRAHIVGARLVRPFSNGSISTMRQLPSVHSVSLMQNAIFYLKHNANPLRGNYPLSVEATELYENARKGVRDFIGAKSAREIIYSTTEYEPCKCSYGLTNAQKKGTKFLSPSWSTTAIFCHGRWSPDRQEQNCGLSSATGWISIWIRCGNRLQKRRRSSQSHRFQCPWADQSIKEIAAAGT